MRAEQRRAMEDKKRTKKEFAVHYTRKEFAPYLSDKDMEQLCRYVELYSEQHPLSDIQPIKVKDLSTRIFTISGGISGSTSTLEDKRI